MKLIQETGDGNSAEFLSFLCSFVLVFSSTNTAARSLHGSRFNQPWESKTQFLGFPTFSRLFKGNQEGRQDFLKT